MIRAARSWERRSAISCSTAPRRRFIVSAKCYCTWRRAPNWWSRSFARALAAGKTVICDRFLLANVVYQGYAGGLDVDALWSVGEVATGGLHPDLTIVLDMEVRAARERMDRALDRMESQGREFLERVRHGFLIESRLQHEHIVVVDAARDIDRVQQDIRSAVARLLKV